MNPQISDCSQITFLSVHAVVPHMCDHLCIAKQKQEGSSCTAPWLHARENAGCFYDFDIIYSCQSVITK